MAEKFFLDADTLADLRADGIVPSPANALRFLRVGAVFFIGAAIDSLFDWSSIWSSIWSSMVSFSHGKLNLAGVFMLLLAPLLAALLVGLAITKGYLSGVPRARPREASPVIAGVRGLILGLGVSAIGIVVLSQSKFVSALVPALYRLTTSPTALAEKLQSMLIYAGGICVVLSLLAGGIEILSYHWRNRRAQIGRR